MNIKTLHIALTLLAVSTACKAQFIDLEWNGSDSVPPSYTNIYDLGYDYRDKECRFEMEYPEYEVATKEEIARYGVDVDALTDDFPVSLHKAVSRKRGCLEVAVYPFAKKGKDVVKLVSLKPVVRISKSVSPPLRMEDAGSRYAEHSVLATGKWVKIYVDEAGVYQLTPQFLSSAGFNTPSKVKVYGYGGEVISEGEAMERYLLEQGVPAERIIREDKSTSTFENMKLSREVVEKTDPDFVNKKTAFATTNYHVFRGYILSKKNGFEAQGISAKTKWYFFPNAFLREFIGLTVDKISAHIIFLVALAAIVAAIEYFI